MIFRLEFSADAERDFELIFDGCGAPEWRTAAPAGPLCSSSTAARAGTRERTAPRMAGRGAIGRSIMRFAKWGNSLAAHLLKALVENLGFKIGDANRVAAKRPEELVVG